MYATADSLDFAPPPPPGVARAFTIAVVAMMPMARLPRVACAGELSISAKYAQRPPM